MTARCRCGRYCKCSCKVSASDRLRAETCAALAHEVKGESYEVPERFIHPKPLRYRKGTWPTRIEYRGSYTATYSKSEAQQSLPL